MSDPAMAKAASAGEASDPLSHNLLGQRLGRKGRDTRKRIIEATERLVAASPGAAITLSAVAREASLAMTTLYLYFGDLSQLLSAVLEPVMETAEESYVAQLRSFWPDDTLGDHCRAFVESYYAFWVRHSRILHLRNSFADKGDVCMRRLRYDSTRPLIRLLVEQMEGGPAEPASPAWDLGAVLMTGMERMVTIATDDDFANMASDAAHPERANLGDPLSVRGLLRASARMVRLAVADRRAERRRKSA
jgi:AcrR family transcriptional regulator